MMAVAGISISLAACSNDEMSSPNGNEAPSDLLTSYVNVKLVMGTGTRAEEDPKPGFNGYDEGTSDEAKIRSLALYLYDANGFLVGSGSTKDFKNPERADNDKDAESVSDSYNQIVEVSLIPGTAQPEKMVAFVNTDEIPTDYPYSKVNEMKVSSVGDLTNGMAMTSAGYYTNNSNENSWMNYNTITSNDLYSTPAEAVASKPIDIYVERLAAKVTVDSKESLDATSDKILYDLDNNQYTITFNPTKWVATGFARNMYLMKNAYGVTLGDWANDIDNHRSYWAKGCYYDLDYDGLVSQTNPVLYYLSANQILSTSAQNGKDLDGKSPDYVTEHTYGTSAYEKNNVFNHQMTATNAIIVGQYTLTAKDPAKGNPQNYKGNKDGEFDFYLALRGFENGENTLTIYTAEQLFDLLVTRNNLSAKAWFKAQNKEDGSALTADDYKDYFELKKTDKNQYGLVIKNGKTLYKEVTVTEPEETTTFVEVEATELNGLANAAHYKNGWAYFFVPIEHGDNLNKDNAVGAVGVVRNHSYKLIVESIKGLGAPLDEDKIGDNPEDSNPDPVDPDDPDYPTPDPDDPGDTPITPDPDMLRDAYINATLKVLSWHNAKDQTVKL